MENLAGILRVVDGVETRRKEEKGGEERMKRKEVPFRLQKSEVAARWKFDILKGFSRSPPPLGTLTYCSPFSSILTPKRRVQERRTKSSILSNRALTTASRFLDSLRAGPVGNVPTCKTNIYTPVIARELILTNPFPPTKRLANSKSSSFVPSRALTREKRIDGFPRPGSLPPLTCPHSCQPFQVPLPDEACVFFQLPTESQRM